MAEDDIIVRLQTEGVDAFIKEMKAAGVAVDKFGDEVDDTQKEIKDLDRDLKDSRTRIDQYGRQFGKTGAQLTSVFKGIAAGVASAFSVAAIVKFTQASIKAADQALKAEAQLLKALDGRADVQQRLIKDAKELQSVTNIEDETIVAQQAYLASLGFTEAKIREIINAAIDYSAGAGKSLDESVKNLAKTFTGTSRELGALIPEIKNLTDEQFRNGEAVKIVSELYKGQAKVLAETGAGPIKALNIAAGELQESFGKAVLEGLAPFAESLKKIAEDKETEAFLVSLGKVLGKTISLIGDAARGWGIFIDELIATPAELKGVKGSFEALDKSDGVQLKTLRESLIATIANLEELQKKGNRVFRFTEASQLVNARKELKLLNDFLAETGTNLDALAAKSQVTLFRGTGGGTPEEKAEAKRRAEELAKIAAEEAAAAAAKKAQDEAEAALKRRLELAKAFEKIMSEGLGQFQEVVNILASGESIALKQLRELQAEFTKTETVADKFFNSLVGDNKLKVSESVQSIIAGYRATSDAATSARVNAEYNAELQADADKKAIELTQQKVSSALEGLSATNQAMQSGFLFFEGLQKREIQALEERRQQGLIGEKQYQEEISEIRRKQAVADKAQAVFSILISTSQGIAKTLAQLGLPAAIPAIAIASALGAAQLAAVLAQPIPQFAKGTKYVDGKGYPNGVDTVPAYLTKGERVVTADKNRKYWDVLNAVHEDSPDMIIKAIAKMGIPVQFKATQDELYRPMSNMQKLISGADRDGIDLNPLIMASDRSRFSLGRKLDKINDNLTRIVDTRKMTKA